MVRRDRGRACVAVLDPAVLVKRALDSLDETRAAIRSAATEARRCVDRGSDATDLAFRACAHPRAGGVTSRHAAVGAGGDWCAVERTEGWIAGIKLTLLESPAASASRASITTCARTSRPKPGRSCRSACVTFCSRPACRSDSAVSSRSRLLKDDAAAQCVDEVEQLQLFVRALDDRHCWLRYHALYRAFLLAQLRKHGAARLAQLHRASSQWFIEHERADRRVAACVRDGGSILVPARADAQCAGVAAHRGVSGGPAVDRTIDADRDHELPRGSRCASDESDLSATIRAGASGTAGSRISWRAMSRSDARCRPCN